MERKTESKKNPRVCGEIKAGYGVASGKEKDVRYPEGSLKQQSKHFLKQDLDLSNYFMVHLI